MAAGAELECLIRSIAAFDVSSVAEDDLKRAVLASQALANAANALASSVLEELDRRGPWAEDGALSAVSWAAPRTGAPKAALQGQVQAGRALRLLPSAVCPARAGRLSASHLASLASCAGRHPELAARDEDVLVGQALELDAKGFRLVVRHWCDRAADAAASEPQPGPEPTSQVHLSPTIDGWWALDGLLSPEDGAIVDAALGAEVDRQLRAQRDGDPAVGRAASELRAEALVELAAKALRGDEAGSVPDRYRVAVVVRPHEVDDLGVAGCDSFMYRVVVGAAGEVLDVGRQQRPWPRGIRRAITYRDGGCCFPGCDRPISWCDVHHCRPWEHDGTTSVDNGALLCRRHHTFIHKRRWRITIEDGKPVTYKADGSRHHLTKWQLE